VTKRFLALVSAGYLLLWGCTLNFTSFWGDEEFTAKAVERGWGAMIQMLNRDMHPPLYYACLRLWHAVFNGLGVEISLRSFSLFCGLLSLWAWHRVFERIGASARAAAGAIFMLAFAPFVGWYAGEAKMYQFYVLVAALAWLAWLRLMERPQSWGRILAAALATAAVPLTHITGMLGVSAFGFWLALGWWRGELSPVQRKAAWVALGLALLIFFPQWRVAKNQVEQTHSFWAAAPSWNLASDLAGYVELYMGAGAAAGGWAYGLWIAMATGGLAWALFAAPWPLRRMLLAAIAAFFGAYWAGSHYRIPFLIPRVTLPWVPLLFLGIASALERWGGRWALGVGAGLFIATCLPGALWMQTGPAREDMRGAVAMIQRYAQPGDPVARASYLEDYYLQRAGLTLADGDPGWGRYWLLRRGSDAGQKGVADWRQPEKDPLRYRIVAKRSFISTVADFWTLDLLLVEPRFQRTKRKA
jgi:hypothetical protein